MSTEAKSLDYQLAADCPDQVHAFIADLAEEFTLSFSEIPERLAAAGHPMRPHIANRYPGNLRVFGEQVVVKLLEHCERKIAEQSDASYLTGSVHAERVSSPVFGLGWTLVPENPRYGVIGTLGSVAGKIMAQDMHDPANGLDEHFVRCAYALASVPAREVADAWLGSPHVQGILERHACVLRLMVDVASLGLHGTEASAYMAEELAERHGGRVAVQTRAAQDPLEPGDSEDYVVRNGRTAGHQS